MASPPRSRKLLHWMVAAAALSTVVGVIAVLAVGRAIPLLHGKDVGAGFASVEKSLCALASDGMAEIIIGGDSRAKQQVDPLLLDSLTGSRAINVAEAITFGGDLPTLANSLARVPGALDRRPLLIVSVSVTGHNDLAFDDLPAACALNWHPVHHMGAALTAPIDYLSWLFGWYLPFLKRHISHKREGSVYSCGDGAAFPPALIASRGYRPILAADTASKPSGSPVARSKSDFLLDGGRRYAFRHSLARLAAGAPRGIILYQAPMAPDWQADPAHRVDVEMEKRFGALVATDAALFRKVRFLDYFSEPPEGLTQAHFADNYHLNAEGAAIFTRALAEAVMDPGKVVGPSPSRP